MNGTQYEEFCRLFLSDKFRIPIEAIQSCRVSSATHPNLSEYKNQIDLYWKDENELARYVNIADAKWRGSDKVPIGKVRELQQVKEDINAHKAMMITNIGFTRDAKNFAENKGIALHIVHPTFDYTTLHLKDRETIQAQLQEPFTGNKPFYTHEVVYRAFDFGTDAAEKPSDSSKTGTHSKVVVPTYSKRVIQAPTNRMGPPGSQKSQGGHDHPPTGRRDGPGQRVQNKSSRPPTGGRGSGGRSNRER